MKKVKAPFPAFLSLCFMKAKKEQSKERVCIIRGYRKSSKYDLTLSSDLEEILIGLMLGDLFAEKSKEKSNTRLQFKQSIKNKVYIEHLYNLFEKYCNSPPHINTSIEKRPGKKELNESIKF